MSRRVCTLTLVGVSIIKAVAVDFHPVAATNFLSGFGNISEDPDIHISPPMPDLTVIGEGFAGDLPPDAQMIKPGLGCPQADRISLRLSRQVN